MNPPDSPSRLGPSQWEWWRVVLVTVAFGVVGGLFILSGIGKFLTANSEVPTMLARYLKQSDSIRAMACLEMALGLWLLSGRLSRVSMIVALLLLAFFTLLIYRELQQAIPLACGCMEIRPGALDPERIRRGLWLSFGRNIGLMVLGLTGVLLVKSGKH